MHAVAGDSDHNIVVIVKVVIFTIMNATMIFGFIQYNY